MSRQPSAGGAHDPFAFQTRHIDDHRPIIEPEDSPTAAAFLADADGTGTFKLANPHPFHTVLERRDPDIIGGCIASKLQVAKRPAGASSRCRGVTPHRGCDADPRVFVGQPMKTLQHTSLRTSGDKSSAGIHPFGG